MLGTARTDESREGVDRCQPLVPRRGRALALVFDVNQEPTNNVRRHVLHLQLIHCLTELFGRMRQEQGQGVAVAGLRVARQVEVRDEMLEKKAPDPRRHELLVGGHG